MAFKNFFIALIFAVWAQCDGIGWTGGTTWVSGTTCTFSNPYYSQCLPGAATTTMTTTNPPPTTTIVPTTTVLPVSDPTTPIGTPTTSVTSTPPTGTPTSCPVLPATLTLKSVAKLPDPFTFAADGSKVTTKAQWTCPIRARNPSPQTIFRHSMTLPSSGTAPYPAIIAIGGLSIPTPTGVAVLNFNNDDMAAQTDSTSRGKGKFYALYGSSTTASSMMVGAWGVSRIIDVLEVTPSLNIDLTKLAVSGCSRNGKGAMVAGAFEPRISLTIPQESGSGGAGCWRISDAILAAGTSTQTTSEIVGENVWFSTNFANYVNAVPTLPFDHHMLAALIAPRTLLVIDNTGIDWLGAKSVWGCMKTANKVWQALGVPANMGVSQVGNHAHCTFPSSEQPDLDAFINKFLKGQSTNTAFVKTDGTNGLGFVDSDWVDWTIPTLT